MGQSTSNGQVRQAFQGLVGFVCLLLPTCLASSDFQARYAAPGLVLYGQRHPHFPVDDRFFPRLADSLAQHSRYFQQQAAFSCGQQFLERLQKQTAQYGELGPLAIIAHSGRQGFFVRKDAGFYRDGLRQDTAIHFRPGVAFVSRLRALRDSGQIRFGPEAFFLLLGCNTAYGPDPIAYRLFRASGVPVMAFRQKVDLYHVSRQGQQVDPKRAPEMVRYAHAAEGYRGRTFCFSGEGFLSLSAAIAQMEQQGKQTPPVLPWHSTAQ